MASKLNISLSASGQLEEKLEVKPKQEKFIPKQQ
jgi:hypothetical protein